MLEGLPLVKLQVSYDGQTNELKQLSVHCKTSVWTCQMIFFFLIKEMLKCNVKLRLYNALNIKDEKFK